MFCEHLADADDAALKRLVTVYILHRHPFEGVSFLCYPLIHENIPFHGQHHQFRHFVHENARFRGYAEQNDTSVHEIGRIRGQVGGFAVFVHGTGPYRGRQDVSFVLCRMKNYSYLWEC